MKYFLYALWRDFQKGYSEKTEREWNNNSKLYLDSLVLVQPYLSKKIYKIFSQGFFHDSQLIAIDTSSYGIIVLNIQKGENLYKLKFKGMKNWSIRFDAQNDFLSLDKMLEWGYEEISISTDDMLNLEILFSSGAIFEIKFNRLQIEKFS